MSQKLSVVLITYNEEKNIRACLEAATLVADDMVVVDSFSTDATAQICKEFSKVHFVQKKWEGYSFTKNYANSLAQAEWILSLDADEVLSASLQQAILSLKNANSLQTASICRITNYCGQWIKHCGWYPEWKLRLFKKSDGHWEGSIHEQLLVPNANSSIQLKGDCLHYSYYTVDDHLKQTEKFSTLAAHDLFAKGKKSTLIKRYVSPLAKFIKSYIFQLGFLDGYNGWLICKISAKYVAKKYSKLAQLHNG